MFVLLSFLSNTAFNFVIGLLLARFLGPDQYGRFALAVAIAAGLQTILFDWARVAATRFFGHDALGDDPGLRPTIEAAFVGLAAAAGGVTLLIIAARLSLPLPGVVIALAVALAIVNGVFDYGTALIRARFEDRAYARLILTKNAMSACITLGGAYWFGSAAVALVGLGLSMGGGMLAVRTALVRPRGAAGRPAADLARTLLAYALPVVLANLLYQTIPLVDRLLIAQTHGFAQSGQFSLAYDIGIRVVAAIGSALDVLLFQIAVRADAVQGSAEARRQIGINIGIMIAVLLPACIGLWLVLPSFEAVVVPPEFRGPFALYLRLLLPGLFCYGMLFFALHPLFQIERRTRPLVAVACIAAVVNLALVLVWPSTDARPYAEAQVVTLALALLLLAGWGLWTFPSARPRGRDTFAAVGAALAMILAIEALPAMEPNVITLLAQVGVGVASYVGAALVFDLCDLRQQMWRAMRKKGI